MNMFDVGKSRMIGLPYGEKNYDDVLSRFHTIPACHGQSDGLTDRITISISRVSVLTRDKNELKAGLVLHTRQLKEDNESTKI